MVELDGGEAVVEMTTTGPLGNSVTPCASTASPTWYFAEGLTTLDATEILVVFNPFPEDAVVDFVFTTEEGQVTPQALTGLSVQGRGVTAVNVGDYVQRREAVAARVSARTGRLVVTRIETFDAGVGRKGVSELPGRSCPGASVGTSPTDWRSTGWPSASRSTTPRRPGPRWRWPSPSTTATPSPSASPSPGSRG